MKKIEKIQKKDAKKAEKSRHPAAPHRRGLDKKI
jgi:hypothetical protein